MSKSTSGHTRGFDIQALFVALDEQRRERGLSWTTAVADISEMNAFVYALRQRPISPSMVSGMSQRGDASCQHALAMVRWLQRVPEDFVVEPHPATLGVPLLEPHDAYRLRWNLSALYQALNDAREKRGVSWLEMAQRLRCTPHQLTGLRTAKFAIGMRLAMRICQALRRPSADFIYPANW